MAAYPTEKQRAILDCIKAVIERDGPVPGRYRDVYPERVTVNSLAWDDEELIVVCTSLKDGKDFPSRANWLWDVEKQKPYLYVSRIGDEIFIGAQHCWHLNLIIPEPEELREKEQTDGQA